MTDEHTDYTSMFGGEEAEPETIEDLVDLEVVPVEEPVLESGEEAFEIPEPEPADETTPLIFVPTVPEGRHLNIRSAPDGDIKFKVDSDTLLICIEDGPEWAWVEFEWENGEMVRGYAKKDFLVVANG